MPRVDETAKSALRASGDGSHRDREFGRWAVTAPATSASTGSTSNRAPKPPLPWCIGCSTSPATATSVTAGPVSTFKKGHPVTFVATGGRHVTFVARNVEPTPARAGVNWHTPRVAVPR
jgi:hypothetical protein